MSEPVFDFLSRGYHSLRQNLAAGRIDQQQFLAQVANLRGQDSRGTWWMVDPASGRLLCYDGQQWVAPAPVDALPTRSPSNVLQPGQAQTRPGSRLALAVSIGVPLFFAFLWFIWSSIRAGYEGLDCLTPLIMGGVPVLLILLHRPLDRLLCLIQPVRRRFPKPILWGVALALPVVVGLISSSLTYSGLGGMRFSMLVSMLGSFVLLREPGGPS
jgi:hypothetical protein